MPRGRALGQPHRLQPVRRAATAATSTSASCATTRRRRCGTRHVERRQSGDFGSYTTFSPIGNPFPDDSQSLAIVTTARACSRSTIPTRDAGRVEPRHGLDPRRRGAARRADGGLVRRRQNGGLRFDAESPGSGSTLSNGAIATMSYSGPDDRHVRRAELHRQAAAHSSTAGASRTCSSRASRATASYIVFNASHDAWRDLTDEASPARGSCSRREGRVGDRPRRAEPRRRRQRHDLGPLGAGRHDRLLLGRLLERARLRPHADAREHLAELRRQRHQECKQLWIGAIDKKKLTGGAMPPDIRARRRCGSRVKTHRRQHQPVLDRSDLADPALKGCRKRPPMRKRASSQREMNRKTRRRDGRRDLGSAERGAQSNPSSCLLAFLFNLRSESTHQSFCTSIR